MASRDLMYLDWLAGKLVPSERGIVVDLELIFAFFVGSRFGGTKQRDAIRIGFRTVMLTGAQVCSACVE
jgi:hypothetical protein